MQELQELIHARTMQEFLDYARSHAVTSEDLAHEVYSCTDTEAFNEEGREPTPQVQEMHDHRAEVVNANGLDAQLGYLHEQLGSRGLYEFFRSLMHERQQPA